MVNQNQLMQLFDFFTSRRSENAWNVFLSTGVCHSRSFQIPVVGNDVCCYCFAGSDVEGVRLAVAAIPGSIFVDVCFVLPFCVKGLKPSTFAKN